MKDKFHHRGPRGNRNSAKPFVLCPPRLCVLRGKFLFGVILAAILTSTIAARPQTRQPLPPEKRIRYQIHLLLDVETWRPTGPNGVDWTTAAKNRTSPSNCIVFRSTLSPGISR